jgi:hypothetical protein
MLGSMVQNGKFALCAFAFDKQLKRVDFPTFGNPTIPAFIKYSFYGQTQAVNSFGLRRCKYTSSNETFNTWHEMLFEKSLGFISLKIYMNLTIIGLVLLNKP